MHRQLILTTEWYTEVLNLLSGLFWFRSFAMFPVNKVWFFTCSIYDGAVFLNVGNKSLMKTRWTKGSGIRYSDQCDLGI